MSGRHYPVHGTSIFAKIFLPWPRVFARCTLELSVSGGLSDSDYIHCVRVHWCNGSLSLCTSHGAHTAAQPAICTRATRCRLTAAAATGLYLSRSAILANTVVFRVSCVFVVFVDAAVAMLLSRLNHCDVAPITTSERLLMFILLLTELTSKSESDAKLKLNR